MPEPPLGAHVSAAGGIDKALERASELGYEAAQVFVKSPQQWAAPALRKNTVQGFRAARATSRVEVFVAHAAYLLNLASPDTAIRARSRKGLADELVRCDRLGIEYLVVHPGAHMGAGEDRGLARIADSLDRILRRHSQCGTRVLLENTAGQGTVLGHRLEHLERVRADAACGDRLGICLDTCHLFAAGYSIKAAKGYAAFLERLDDLLAQRAICCLHLNDSQHPRGSRRDRHANLGDGKIGSALFRRLVREPRLAAIPMILETPIGDDRQGHVRDFARLLGWRRRCGPLGERS